MKQTSLKTDKEIWGIFIIVVLSSVAILFLFFKNYFYSWSLILLSLQFSIVVYSGFLLVRCRFEEKANDSEDKYFPKLKWVAELLSLGIVFVFMYAFSVIWIYYVIVPVLILCFFVIVHLYNNKEILIRTSFKK